MNKFSEASNLLKIIVIGAYLISFSFVLSGIALVYLGATGDTDFNFFGQTFKSQSVGIASIFLGAATIVLLIRYSLKSFNKFIENGKESVDTQSDKNQDKKEKLYNNFLKPAYDRFNKAHENYIVTFKKYRKILSSNGHMTKDEIKQFQDLLYRDSNFHHDLRITAIQEAALLENTESYNFDSFISAIRRYFCGPIEGKSKLIKAADRIEMFANAPRNVFFMTLEILANSLENRETRELVTVQGIDEIILHIQKQNESVNKEFFTAKRSLLGM